MLYDTHSHLNDEAFAGDLDEVIDRAKACGVAYINVVGCDLPSSERAVELAEKYDCIYAAVGIHPSDADTYDREAEAKLRQWAELPKTVAIGEIGLDYHFEDDVDHEIQREVFHKQLLLSLELNLPVIIHSRDAFEDTIKILKQELPEDGYRGVFHCFSGSSEQSKICLDMGFYLGFDGPLTFKNSKKPVRVCQDVDLDRLLVETDCPYMAPEPVRGRRNEPAFVKHVCTKLGDIKEINYEEAAAATTANAKSLFGI